MRDDDEGAAKGARQSFQELDVRKVKIIGRLIENEEFRLRRTQEAPRQRRSQPFTAA